MSFVMRMLYWCTVVKRKLSMEAKLSIYQLVYIPALIYGHKDSG